MQSDKVNVGDLVKYCGLPGDGVFPALALVTHKKGYTIHVRLNSGSIIKCTACELEAISENR